MNDSAMNFAQAAWRRKAELNTLKWGPQPPLTLVAVLSEEMGEVSKAVIDWIHSGGDIQRVQDEVDDLAAVCFQMVDTLARLRGGNGGVLENKTRGAI